MWRELARAVIARFREVQLVCPRDICVERARAVRWRLGTLALTPRVADPAEEAPVLTLDYEPSLRPELTLYTDVQDPWSIAEEVLCFATRLHRRGDP